MTDGSRYAEYIEGALKYPLKDGQLADMVLLHFPELNEHLAHVLVEKTLISLLSKTASIKDTEIRDFIKKWESPQYSTPGFVHLVIPVKVANKFEVEGMMARKKIGKFIPNAVTSSNRKNQSL